jgi:hypothetical protein
MQKKRPWIVLYLSSNPSGPDASRPYLCPTFCTTFNEPCSFSEVPAGPYIFLISSGSKQKEPRFGYLSEAKASHSHQMWTEVSSSVPHFLQVGLLLNPIIYKCLLKVLCPVSRPITTLACVLLKDKKRPYTLHIFSQKEELQNLYN